MPSPFEFATASRILFGCGTIQNLGREASKLGSRVFFVTGSASRAHAKELFEAEALATCSWNVTGEPSTAEIETGRRIARENRCDVVVAIGGGSVIDAGKAVAAMLANPGDLIDYLEVVGAGKALPNLAAPFIAVPTTAGTGSEVTRNAVLTSPAPTASAHRAPAQLKVSLRSVGMLPRVAVVDPDLTKHLPPELTATTGMDALTQLIEPFVCTRANAITDAICREGMARVARSLLAAFEDGSNMAAREDMCAASLFGGMALANAGLGAVHGFAGPMGGMFHAPHGALCAALLPHVMRKNIEAISARGLMLERFEEVARILTGKPDANAQCGVEWVEQLVRKLAIAPLRTFGIQQADFARVVENARAASSMKANPLPLTDGELTEILEAAF